MFFVAESGTTVVRLDDRFDAPQVRSIEQVLTVLGPVPRLVIDFRNVREVDEAALASLAGSLRAFPGSRVTLRGLSRHVRRVLRYLGLELALEAAAAGDGAAPLAADGRA